MAILANIEVQIFTSENETPPSVRNECNNAYTRARFDRVVLADDGCASR